MNTTMGTVKAELKSTNPEIEQQIVAKILKTISIEYKTIPENMSR